MKKKRIYLLSAILGVLIILTLITTLTDNKKAAGNFSSELLSIDPAEITTVRITPGNEQEHFSLVKTGENWMVQSATNEYNASASTVENLLSTLNDLNASQIVTQNRDAWGEYSVDDTTGTKVELFSGEKTAGGLVIGRMTFAQSRNPNQQQPDAFTYVRKEGEKPVYKTRGMLSMSVSGGIDGFRSSVITNFTKSDLQEIAFTYPADSSFVVSKKAQTWEINGNPADSSSMESYLNTIRNFTSRSFSTEEHPPTTPEFIADLTGEQMEPITVSAWQSGDGEYYLHSTANKGTLFLLNEEQFTRLFIGRSRFLK